jgi:hypothetical protein
MNAGSGASDLPVTTRARAYLVALGVTAVAVTGSLPLQRTFDRFPYLPLLVAAVIISAWIGGLGPGLVAAGGGAVAAEYLMMFGLHAVGAYPDLLAQLAIFVMGLIRFGGRVDYVDPGSSSFVEESLQGLGGVGISSRRPLVNAAERPVAI